MLVARGGLAEPAVVGGIEQNLRAVRREAADEAREHGFVADERGRSVLAERGEIDLLRARPEIAAPPERSLKAMGPSGHGMNSPNGTRFILS